MKTQTSSSTLAKTDTFVFTPIGEAFGKPKYLAIYRGDEKVGQFSFNMTGFVADFKQVDPVSQVEAHYPERSQKTVEREFRQNVKRGFTEITPFD